MNDPVFWMVVLAVAAPVCFTLGFRNWRLARLIEDTPVSRVRSAAQGYVELCGTARLADGNPNLAPLTRLPCVWWQFRVERKSGVGRNTRWQTVSHGSSIAPFGLVDETGECLVNPLGANVKPSNKSTWRGSSPWPAPPGEGQRFLGSGGGEYRYLEYRINEQEPVNVIGEFRTLGGIEATDVTGEVAHVLTDWKQDQPGLLRRFDTDHDGVLSQSEWESVRRSARLQIVQRAPSAPQPTANVVVRPRDHRPFLVAACDLRVVARRSRWAAAALLTGFLVAVGTLARMLLDHG